MSRPLLLTTIPITLVPAGAPPQAPPPSAPTPLRVELTHATSSDKLTLTLSDLPGRQLLLRETITAATYAPLRSSQALHIDFAAFGPHLATLLRRVASGALLATLATPPAPAAPGTAAPLRILQADAVKTITHLELSPTVATPADLLAALSSRARDAAALETQVVELSTRVDAADAAVLAARADANERERVLQDELATARAEAEASARRAVHADQLADELAQARAAADDAGGRAAGAAATVDALAAARADAARARAEVEALRVNEEAARAAQVTAERERDTARAEIARARAQRDEAAAEITRGNALLERLQNALRESRARGKARAAVAARQEDTIRRLEARVAELEREARRARDRAALLEVEKEGFRDRVREMEMRAEESAAVRASDERVIAYLNRELNEQALGAERTGALGVASGVS